MEGETFELNPIEIAETLFENDPKPECSICLISENEGTDTSMIFEILLSILLEGLDRTYQGLNNIDFNILTEDHIEALNPWFRSLGYNIRATIHDKEDIVFYDKYYCRIIIRTPIDEGYFFMKGLDTNYHFVLNGNHYEEVKKCPILKDYYCIYQFGDKFLSVSFDVWLPSNMNKCG